MVFHTLHTYQFIYAIINEEVLMFVVTFMDWAPLQSNKVVFTLWICCSFPDLRNLFLWFWLAINSFSMWLSSLMYNTVNSILVVGCAIQKFKPFPFADQTEIKKIRNFRISLVWWLSVYFLSLYINLSLVPFDLYMIRDL